MQYYPVYRPPIVKNKYATASFVVSIISIALLILIIPSMFIGGFLMSCGGQSPQSSGVDLNDPEAVEEFFRDSRRLGAVGLVFILTPPILSGISAILGLVFGLIGRRKPGKREQAIAGIVMSGVALFFGFVGIVRLFL